jgi:hypothetical protein
MGEDYPKNQWEFEQRFRSEADCVDYLIKLRWPGGFLDVVGINVGLVDARLA